MAKDRLISIAAKLTRMNMLVSGVALVLACAGFVAFEVATFRQGIVRNLSIQSQVAGSNSVSALIFDDPASAQRTLSAFRAAPSIVSASVYTAEGKLFAAYERDPGGASVPVQPGISPDREESYWFQRGNVMLVHTIMFQGKLTGFVFIQSDLETLRSRLKSYALIATGMLVFSLLAALLVSRIARRSIAEPVVRLADAAREVSRDQNYAIRAKPGQEEGELAVLFSTFNQMLEYIEKRDRHLQSAHDELEKRVLERTAELSAANKELESFSYSVSHDLRAPLRSIDGFSQALCEDYSETLDSCAKGYLDRVRAATQRMGQLIDDLLNLARVTRAEMHRESVDLSAMASSVATELVKAEGERQVAWNIEPDVEAFADPRLLRVVLDNLLGNAWKYTSKHPQARIEFGRQHSNGSAFYFVRDDGAGFDPAYSERLFGAFQRLHGVTEFPGSGIGLATVHRIIHRHGGRIWAEAAVEKGATFYFTLGPGTKGGSHG